MKKKYVAIIMFLSIFLFTKAESAEDVPDNVSGLQVEVKRLADRVKLLEKELSKVQDSYQTPKSNQESILNLVSRLEIVEKKHEESSAETINTLKEAVAELRKRMEVQDITMDIFEKKYKVSQKPLEPIEKSIKNQTKTISKIVARLDEQEQMIKSLSEKTGIEITASRIIKKELEDELVHLPDAEVEIRISKFLNDGNHYEIGGGFYAKGLMFEPFGTSVKFSGIILNASESDVNIANLSIYIHNKEDAFIWDQEFRITGIKRGNTKSFSEILTGIEMEQIRKYALVFGLGTKPTQFIDLMADTLGKNTATNLEKKETIEKMYEEEQYEEEQIEDVSIGEFKDVGGGFFIKDVTVTGIDYGVKISSTLNNSTGNFHSVAGF